MSFNYKVKSRDQINGNPGQDLFKQKNRPGSGMRNGEVFMRIGAIH